MQIFSTALPGVLLIEPTVISDNRGLFFESYNQTKFLNLIGENTAFVQDNESLSYQAVLRGLHYQVNRPQGKLVRVSEGEVFDVAVDIRENSPTFGKWIGEKLSAENKKQLWIPAGFAHGFLVLSPEARFHYKVTDYWYPEHERCIRFDDPTLNIHWPPVLNALKTLLPPILSEKDRKGVFLNSAELF